MNNILMNINVFIGSTILLIILATISSAVILKKFKNRVNKYNESADKKISKKSIQLITAGYIVEFILPIVGLIGIVKEKIIISYIAIAALFIVSITKDVKEHNIEKMMKESLIRKEDNK